MIFHLTSFLYRLHSIHVIPLRKRYVIGRSCHPSFFLSSPYQVTPLYQSINLVKHSFPLATTYCLFPGLRVSDNSCSGDLLNPLEWNWLFFLDFPFWAFCTCAQYLSPGCSCFKYNLSYFALEAIGVFFYICNVLFISLLSIRNTQITPTYLCISGSLEIFFH